jgi:AraC-like DNA-binding protein
MTGTPLSIAEAPAASADVLSDVLRAVRLTGAVFLSARFTAPFGILSPERYDPRMPMAHLRHISIFHLIVAGGCTIETAGGERRDLMAGDLVLLPFTQAHKFWNGQTCEMVFAPSLVRRGKLDGVWTVDHGGGGAETRMICGFLESQEFLFAPLFRSLPEIVVENAEDQKLGAMMSSTVREAVALVEAATPGAQMMLGRIMEMLFVEVLRRHSARLPGDRTGWLPALKDPIVGRALQQVHKDPARKWTVEDLARETGSSRSVLAERFTALLGRPPMDYVVCWRIQLAADRLRNGSAGIAAIAGEIGYESEAAFSRAFKRVTGLSPGRWRDGAGDSEPLMPLQLNRPLIPDA